MRWVGGGGGVEGTKEREVKRTGHQERGYSYLISSITLKILFPDCGQPIPIVKALFDATDAAATAATAAESALPPP